MWTKTHSRIRGKDRKCSWQNFRFWEWLRALSQPPWIAVPDLEEGQEVGVGIAERRVHRVGLGGLVRRPLARVADAERGGDDGHFAKAALVARLEQDAGDARVERHAGHEPARCP